MLWVDGVGQNLLIWLQKIKKADYLAGKTVQACFVCGSGVYLIIIHPFPKNNKMRLGKKKPVKRVLNYYRAYTTGLFMDEEGWYLQWSEEKIKKYYLETLLLHEIGHSLDSFNTRFWSKASEEKKENCADNYAAIWSDTLRETFE